MQGNSEELGQQTATKIERSPYKETQDNRVYAASVEDLKITAAQLNEGMAEVSYPRKQGVL